jgi:hypothetical protein
MYVPYATAWTKSKSDEPPALSEVQEKYWLLAMSEELTAEFELEGRMTSWSCDPKFSVAWINEAQLDRLELGMDFALRSGGRESLIDRVGGENGRPGEGSGASSEPSTSSLNISGGPVSLDPARTINGWFNLTRDFNFRPICRGRLRYSIISESSDCCVKG